MTTVGRGNHRFGRMVRRLSGFLGVSGPQGQVPYVHPGVILSMPGFPLAAVGETYAQTVSVTGNASYTVITVPVGEVWLVNQIAVDHSSGAWQADDMWLNRQGAGVAAIQLQAMALTADRALHQRLDLWLYPGDLIEVGVSGYSVTGDLVVEVDHLKARFIPDASD